MDKVLVEKDAGSEGPECTGQEACFVLFQKEIRGISDPDFEYIKVTREKLLGTCEQCHCFLLKET